MKRITQLDALRGFALGGIAMSNVLWFSGYAVATVEAQTDFWLDPAITFALHVFVDGKFYALFSLLFGASFALMVTREQAHGRSAKSLVRRRLASLLVLGLVHATAVWFGDIVSLYAVAAVPLWTLLRQSNRALVWWAVGLLASPLAISGVLLLITGSSEAPPLGYGPTAQLPAFASESYRELVSANSAFLVQRWVLALASGRLPRLLGMFLVGVLLLRHRPTLTPRVQKVLWFVAALSNVAMALVSNVAAQPPSSLGLFRDAVTCIAVPSGCLAYASALWPKLGSPGRVTAALAAAGRLSLTHYLSQSLLFATVFYGCGFGLWGRLSATSAVAVGGTLALLQIAISPAWLHRFGTGPGERALRALDGVFAARKTAARG